MKLVAMILAFSFLFPVLGYAKKSVVVAQTNTTAVSMATPAATSIYDQAGTLHISTALNSLASGTANVNVNIFAIERAAFSIMYASKSEKTEPVIKSSFSAGTKVNVDTTQSAVGAAYYVRGLANEINFIINPHVLFQKETDALNVENNVGFGLRADILFRRNHLALTAGAHSILIDGDTKTNALVSAGYIF